jgi:putative heme transporter
VSYDDTGGPPRPRRFPKLRFSLKILAALAVVVFAVQFLVPGFRKAAEQIRAVNPLLLALGLGLEILALYSYTLLTKAALGDVGALISNSRLFRIQMSTKALSSIVPGGSAAGNALGYRLMTLSGVPGPDAGFALATAGVVSAVVLNLIFWLALIVSIPIRGVNPGYATAAVMGIVLLGFFAVLVVGLLEGGQRAEKIFRWCARKLRLNEDRAAASVRHIGGRLDDLASDRTLLVRVGGWATANWLLDAAALWVFLRAFGASTDIDALLVAFGLVNVLAVIPIMPGGLGIVDTMLPLALVGFGLVKVQATLGVATYRLAQLFFPVLLGGILYASLRVGPWSVKKRDRLDRLRDIAADDALTNERAIDFAVRFTQRRSVTKSAINEGSQHHPSAHYPAEGDGNDDVS